MYKLRLKELRKEAGFRTQKEMSDALGIKERRYASWEREEVALTLEDACAVSAALGCTPNDLCGWYETHPREEGTGLAADEADVLSCYRASTPQWRRNIAMCARAAAGESKNEAERGAPAMGVSVAV